MSGGIAYVYDPNGEFASKVNYEMVKLEELTAEDRDFLHDTVTRHRNFTGSTVAEGLLASWPLKVSEFRKVMPTDYKRVLTVIADSEASGLDEAATVEAVMAAARV